MANQNQNPLIGEIIDKYRIDELLGRGGMAEVYRAYQTNLERNVAIKLMYAFLIEEANFLQRFQQEARAMAALNHPNIVDVYDFDVFNARYYIVMQYLSGGTLKNVLDNLSARGKQMSLSQAIQVVLEVADALSYAHSRGMIHRDIKPGNIMLNDRGNAVLTDFGIVRMVSGTKYTATGSMVGTPAYMSPEQGLGEPGDERSDIYALGVVFYGMVTGRLPFDAETPIGVVMKHIHDPVPPPRSLNAAVPEPIEGVILRMMAKKADDRYQSATDLGRDLAAAVLASGDDWLQVEVPRAFLPERNTPAGGKTGVAPPPTRIPARGDQTNLMPVAVETTMEATEVLTGSPALPDGSAASTAVKGPRVPLWLWGILLVLVILGAGGGWLIAGSTIFSGGEGNGGSVGTPVGDSVSPSGDGGQVLAVSQSTDENTAPLPPTSSETPTHTPSPTATETPLPTATPLPSATPTLEPSSTPLPTVDPTAEFLASCSPEIEVINVHTYDNPAAKSAPTGARLTLNWILSNPGNCPWPPRLRLTHLEGERFGFDDPLPVPVRDMQDEPVVISTNQLRAPEAAGLYPSSWQIVGPGGDRFGPVIEFDLLVYAPATPTPPATPIPVATPTATPASDGETESSEPVGFNVFFNRCEYPGGGSEYRCEMLITPFGGSGDQYTIFIFDAEQPARYLGGNQTHFINARRCAPWIHEVKVQNEASGESLSRNIYFDPAAQPLFPGGVPCSEN